MKASEWLLTGIRGLDTHHALYGSCLIRLVSLRSFTSSAMFSQTLKRARSATSSSTTCTPSVVHRHIRWFASRDPGDYVHRVPRAQRPKDKPHKMKAMNSVRWFCRMLQEFFSILYCLSPPSTVPGQAEGNSGDYANPEKCSGGRFCHPLSTFSGPDPTIELVWFLQYKCYVEASSHFL